MDYPKSVPSAGLVNGKFVDENPINGTPGSLIPAAWGNGVTEEIVNVIKAAAIVPDEQDHSQLQQAIAKSISDKLPVQAAETNAGVMKVATQDQVVAGVDDTVAVTPKKMKLGFSLVNGTWGGYFAFPFWMGGLVIQWGYVNSAATDVTTTLPVSFNSAFYGLTVSNGYTPTSGSIGYLAASPKGLSAITSRGSSAFLGAQFIAIGR
ncbi:hypothetical protein [Pseudomonas sp. FW215-L1]|uniref:gp53-like domain-containing protein n=1 Tax=unclassified Pseudomonas TaxID=196821 RepID=UPI00268DB043